MKNCVWIHAVSYGEAQVAFHFIRTGLEKGYTKSPVLFTSTIENAITDFEKKFHNQFPNHPFQALFLPLDFYPVMKRWIQKFNPSMFILVETDFWPSLLYILGRKKVPVFLVNGRISDSISTGFANFSNLTNAVLKSFRYLFVQYPEDLNKLPVVLQKKTSALGNAKLDSLEICELSNSLKALKKENQKIIVFGSFHEDELPWIQSVLDLRLEKVKIFVAPRNIEKASVFLKKLKYPNLQSCLFSEGRAGVCDLVIIDKMGLLTQFYRLCDLAIVGGSFNQIGGHNFLEPLYCKRPCITGKYMRNYQHDWKWFLEQKIIHCASTKAELCNLVLSFVGNPKPWIEESLIAHRKIIEKQGVLETTWKKILES